MNTSEKTRVIIIAGTDTDIGKTYVTATLAASWIAKGKSVSICKPIQTGLNEIKGDVDWICSHVPGIQRRLPEDEVIIRCQFPASPELALRLEGRDLSLHALGEKIEKVVESCSSDILLIELAGGLMVPINHLQTNLDLIALLKYEVILVTANKLGTVNHTLLSLMALRSIHAKVTGVIMNRCPVSPDVLGDDNLATVKKWAGVPCLWALPECEKITPVPIYF